MDTTTTAVTTPATVAGGDSWPPVRHCPAHRQVLSGGPVTFWCPQGRLGHQVMAADLDDDTGQAPAQPAPGAGVAA